MSDFTPEISIEHLIRSLTPEQQEALNFLQEGLPKIIINLINNNPDRVPDLLKRLTERGKKILPDGQTVEMPSAIELMKEAIRANNQEALKAARRVKSGITPPSAPFPLDENPKE
jgi:hypothetical protein